LRTETHNPKDMTMNRIPSLTLVLPLLIVGACAPTVENETIDLTDFEFAAFEISNPSGSVSIVGGDDLSMHSERIYTGEEAPEVTLELVGDTLVVEVTCLDGPALCTVNQEIILPPGTTLRTGVGSGSTTVSGMEADLDAVAGSGTITVRDHLGAVTAEIGSGEIVLDTVSGDVDLDVEAGSIEGLHLDVAQLVGEIESGDVVVQWDTAPEDVLLQATSGAVTVTDAYNLRLETVAGGVSVTGLTDDDLSERVIEVSVTSGSISVCAD
jgi:hypothetical protein